MTQYIYIYISYPIQKKKTGCFFSAMWDPKRWPNEKFMNNTDSPSWPSPSTFPLLAFGRPDSSPIPSSYFLFFTPWKLKSLNWKLDILLAIFLKLIFYTLEISMKIGIQEIVNFKKSWGYSGVLGLILLGISLINFTKSPTVHPVCCDGCTGALQEDVKNKYSRCLYLYVYKKLDVQNLYIFSKALCIKEKVLLNFIKPLILNRFAWECLERHSQFFLGPPKISIAVKSWSLPHTHEYYCT